MPMNEIWSLLKPSNKQYATVIQKIEEKPDLANEVREDTKCSLVMEALRFVSNAKEEEDALKLLAAIAKSPAFNTFSLATPAGNTPIKAILSTCNPKVLNVFIEKPYIITSGSILTYAEATKKIGLLSTAPEKQAKLIEMRKSIREKTILAAIQLWKTEQVDSATLQKIDLAKVGNPEEQSSIMNYLKASSYVAKLDANYEAKKALNPESVETRSAHSELENATLMRALFRDKIIEEAVAKDKPSILEGLEKAGDKIGFFTEDNETYLTLAKKDPQNPKNAILAYQKKRCDASALKFSQLDAAFQNKLAKANELAKKLEECKSDYYDARGKVHAESLALNKAFSAAMVSTTLKAG